MGLIRFVKLFRRARRLGFGAFEAYLAARVVVR